MSNKVISTHTLSTTWRTSTTAYFLYQNGDSTYYKAELSGYVSTISEQLAIHTNDISSLNTLKAAVAQSTWISVAYSSNWVDYSTTYAPSAYFKDTLGFVHLRIGAKTGASNPIFTLPAGYTPEYQMIYWVYSTPTSTMNPNVYITSTGGVNAQHHSATLVLMGEQIFKAST